MTRDDVVKLLMMIQATFPNFKVENKTETVNSWLFFLEEYDSNEIVLALKSYVKSNNSGFAPSCSQLIAELDKPKEMAQMDIASAWSLVRTAIGKSTYNSQTEFDKLPPTVQKAVGSASVLYSWATDENYNEGVVMALFEKNFKTIQQRELQFDKMPTEMQLRVEQFIEKAQMLEDNTLLIGSKEPYVPPNVEPNLDSDYVGRLKKENGWE